MSTAKASNPQRNTIRMAVMGTVAARRAGGGQVCRIMAFALETGRWGGGTRLVVFLPHFDGGAQGGGAQVTEVAHGQPAGVLVRHAHGDLDGSPGRRRPRVRGG